MLVLCGWHYFMPVLLAGCGGEGVSLAPSLSFFLSLYRGEETSSISAVSEESVPRRD